ncbi:hypothetical protein AB3Z07_26630 (plasmid) [Metabacillus halosaccharovorans]|uniref:hypothetical protein n=1 Tax=Bacillaceae TaxID=186817 RepID=UPI0020407C6B|nr:hypothetical protein [Metabacillus halosaccharovorans]MCM3441539.1 hypothetical protein [Metabacillus halosaccharovorans]
MEVLKKLLTSIVAVALFLGIGTAALAHSNSTPSQGNGNWQQMMDYCSEMMTSFMNNHQNNIQHETSTSKNLNIEQTNSNDSTTNNHQNQKHFMYDDC